MVVSVTCALLCTLPGRQEQEDPFAARGRCRDRTKWRGCGRFPRVGFACSDLGAVIQMVTWEMGAVVS